MLDYIDKLTAAKIRKICHDENICNYSKLKKKELVIYVKQHLIQKMIDEGIEKLSLL